MSADNGIYIAQFRDGFRVIHAQAIENIDYYEEGTPEWRVTNKDFWGKSKVFVTFQEALKGAHILSQCFPFLEYGICQTKRANGGAIRPRWDEDIEKFNEWVKNNPQIQEKDVHTEHCCASCGCKYGDDSPEINMEDGGFSYGCSVFSGVKKQSYPCGKTSVCYREDEEVKSKEIIMYGLRHKKTGHLLTVESVARDQHLAINGKRLKPKINYTLFKERERGRLWMVSQSDVAEQARIHGNVWISNYQSPRHDFQSDELEVVRIQMSVTSV